jgi:hypothetical protein
MADLIEAVVRAALAPVVERLRALEPLGPEVHGTRERIASLEARAPAAGPPGPPGANGLDGLGFDDYTVTYDGERTVTHRWARGERSGESVITLPTPIYQGVFVAGLHYTRGDLVTLDGSMWHANTATTARPGEATSAADWTLAVKRGRDRWVK